MSDWMRAVAAEPAPMPTQPLDEADKQRQPPPAMPTGVPEPQKPMPLSEIMGSLEAGSKAALDASVDLQKAAAAVAKMGAMAGITPMERDMAEKAKAFMQALEALREQAGRIAGEMSDYRSSLSGGAKGWWISK